MAFPRHWSKLSPLSLALWPVSLAYGAAVRLRRALYRSGLLQAEKLPVPVIVIGNLFVGGTGKTPLALALAEHFVLQGLRPGIVCSGYGGRQRTPSRVTALSDPAEQGDEAVLLAGRSGCPVWSGRDRVAAARALLAENPGCDVVLCDDGLQHYRLARDFEIEVLDARGRGNGLLLPAGPLREPATRPVDARVVNSAPSAAADAFGMELKPAFIYRLDRPGEAVDPLSLSGRRVHAIAGTGNPQRFFDTLAGLGFHPVTHAFPDHHPYAAHDLDFPDCDAVVMTEKDAVKCARLGRPDLYALRVDAVVDPGLFERVRKRLESI